MGAPTESAALVKAVQYWKERAKKAEAHYATLAGHVNAFAAQVTPPSEDWDA